MKSLKILFATAIALSVTNAWANLKTSTMSNSYCSPKVHFKLPDGWTNAYLMIGGFGVPFPAPKLADNGWTTINLGSANANDDDVFYINGVNKNDCNDGICVTRNGVNVKPNNASVEGFRCSDIGSNDEIWIQEHPDITKEGQVYVTTSKPVVKDFYIFLPDNKTWRSSTPMLLEDGKNEVEMYVDNEHCGWYYRRYILDGKIDKALPSSVILYRDDDIEKKAAIGMGGEKALNEWYPAEPIALADLFSFFESDPNYHDAVYFLADENQADALGNDAVYGWSATMPTEAVGTCSYMLAAVIYDTDADLHPLFSCYKEGDGFQEGCQKDQSALPAIENCIGVHQGLVESTLAIENGKKKMKLTAAGKKCFLDQATFDMMFTYTKGVNEMSCYDMKFDRSPDGKWEFDSDYYTNPELKTPVQGGFYPVEATDDAKIIATLLPDGSVQTPAPKARTKHWAQGPVFYGPFLRANDPTEQIPKIDIYCNGPGWSKGFDCGVNNHLFADGDGTTTAINQNLKLGTATQEACVFGWSCPNEAPTDWPFYAEDSETKGTATGRWESTEDSKSVNGGRNQHFCFESHAKFRYKPNLKFNFRGDDDIWVFIDNKLAVDIGGIHLAAPGYVDVDYFLKKNGYGLDTIGGRSFDIDIFFCDRRTTMSNVRIKTNMFLEQITGIIYEDKQDIVRYMEYGDNIYKLCYKKSGNGSCAAALGGGDTEECGKDIKEKINFMVTKDKTGQDAGKIVVTSEGSLNNDFFNSHPKFGCSKDDVCAINVTVPGEPIINEEKLSEYLRPGKYYLVAKIGSDSKYIEINVKASIGVANRDAVAIYADGKKNSLHEYKTLARASLPDNQGYPDPSQMLKLYVGTIFDPCIQAGCTDPLDMVASPNIPYTLQVKNDNQNVQFYKMNNGKLKILDPLMGSVIGETGIDTIYVTIPSADMRVAVDSVIVGVSGNSRKATLKFFLPRLVFVDSDSTFNIVTQDPDNVKGSRMKGSSYPFYLVALDAENAPCGELCNFPLTKGSKTSSGINIVAGSQVVNGRATITVQSQKGYEKNADGSGTATLHVVVPYSNFMQATYTNMQFLEPPVPTPQFADIFDVHGVKATNNINVPTPYYSADKEYLDGIGDSLVIYYHREFHKDSLPHKIVVFWENEKDSVVFTAEDIKAGAKCNATTEFCDPVIKLGGKKLSKNVKTRGSGWIKSWASFTSRGVTTVKDYEALIYDRIAPMILSASAFTDNSDSKYTQLTVTFSEPIAKTDMNHGDNIFSFYINAGKNPHFEDSIAVSSGTSNSKNLDSVHTFTYSQKSTFPQVGDYINFRSVNGTGLVSDQSDYASAYADTARPSNDITKQWNIALGYNAKTHLPSPWVQITKGSSSSKNSKSSSSVKITSSSSSSIDYAKPSFRVKMISPFEFDIVLDEDLPCLAKQYAVMDMKGQVLSVGELSNAETRVKVSTPGSYVVRVGLGYRQVNVK